MARYSPRDRNRIEEGTHTKRIRKFNRPPEGEGKDSRWVWHTREFKMSFAVRSLSLNARRSLDRIEVEHCDHAGLENGNLIVTHANFIEYGVSQNLVADAIDELSFKGLIKVERGVASDGSSHPNRYRLTFYGCHEAAAPTNDWKRYAPRQDGKDPWKLEKRQQFRKQRSNDDARRMDNSAKIEREKYLRSHNNESAGSQIDESRAKVRAV